MIVKIDVNPDIQARAKAEGFDRVEDYVQKLIGDDLAGRRGDDHRKLSQEEWKLRLDSLGQGRTGSPLVDDSRESMYVEREARILGETTSD
jgi:hypothetical protein